MKNDKIIQILIKDNEIIGLSDSGKVYEYKQAQNKYHWKLLVESPAIDKHEKKSN